MDAETQRLLAENAELKRRLRVANAQGEAAAALAGGFREVFKVMLELSESMSAVPCMQPAHRKQAEEVLFAQLRTSAGVEVPAYCWPEVPAVPGSEGG